MYTASSTDPSTTIRHKSLLTLATEAIAKLQDAKNQAYLKWQATGNDKDYAALQIANEQCIRAEKDFAAVRVMIKQARLGRSNA